MAECVQGLLLENEALGENYFRLKVACPPLAQKARPGQFVQIKCGEHLDPLLRRPISIHRYNSTDGTLEFLIRRKGKGTIWLGNQKPGADLDLLGPLGRGFSLNQEKALITGGGIGVAPLLALAEALHNQGNPPVTLLGANTAGDLLRVAEFKEVSQSVELATMDGSLGRQGLVTDLLRTELEQGFKGFIYTCGPEPMLEAVAALAGEYGLKGEASLEANMACGVGVCLGCTCSIRKDNGEFYAHVCTDGPVFPLEVVKGYGQS